MPILHEQNSLRTCIVLWMSDIPTAVWSQADSDTCGRCNLGREKCLFFCFSTIKANAIYDIWIPSVFRFLEAAVWNDWCRPLLYLFYCIVLSFMCFYHNSNSPFSFELFIMWKLWYFNLTKKSLNVCTFHFIHFNEVYNYTCIRYNSKMYTIFINLPVAWYERRRWQELKVLDMN